MKNTIIITQIFLVFLGFGSVLNMFYSVYIDFVMLGLNCLLFTFKQNVIISRINLQKLLFIVLILFGHCLIHRDNITLYSGILFRILNVLLFFGFVVSFSDFKKQFFYVLKIISILAALNFVIANVIPGIFKSVENSQTGFGVNTLFYIFNHNSTVNIFSLEILRNQGLFWEPGVLQISLNFYLYYLLIVKNDILRSILIVLLIFSTFSTTGIFVLFIIIVFYFILHFKRKKITIIQVISTLSILIALSVITYVSFFHKLNDEKDNISSIARTYDLYTGIQIVNNNLLTGIGIDDSNYIRESNKLNTNIIDERLDFERGNTNALLTFFVKFGIPITLIFLVGLFSQDIFPYRFIFLIILLIEMSSEPLVFVSLWAIFFFSNKHNNRSLISNNLS